MVPHSCKPGTREAETGGTCCPTGCLLSFIVSFQKFCFEGAVVEQTVMRADSSVYGLGGAFVYRRAVKELSKVVVKSECSLVLLNCGYEQ